MSDKTPRGIPLVIRLSGLERPRPGDEVVIFGLAKAPELNGKKVGVTWLKMRVSGFRI